MTQQYDITQRVLTDEEIQDIADGFDIYGAKPEFARAIESALLSKLRAPVSSIREGFELTYAADADDPACATDLSHFTNGWRACVMSQVRAPVADERAAFEAARRKRDADAPLGRMSLVNNDEYTNSEDQAAWEGWQDRAALASAPVAGEVVAWRVTHPRSPKPGWEDAAREQPPTLENVKQQDPDLVLELAYAAPQASTVAGEAQGWSGWACQYPNKLPRLYGAKEIAQLNCDAANGDRVLFLSEHAAPQASAEPVRDAALVPHRQEWANRGDGYGHWVDVDEARFAVLAPECRRTLYLPQADKDGCTCPSGDGSLRHPCAAHPAKASGNGGEEWSDS